MNKLLPILLMVLFCGHGNARADLTREANYNLMYDFAYCVAFYNILRVNAPEQNKIGNINAKLLKMSQMATYLIDQKLGVKLDVLTDATNKAEDDLYKQINYDVVNIGILFTKYEPFCRNLESNPDARFYYWVNRLKKN